MRPHIVLAGWLAFVSLQAAAAPLGDGHELQKRQATDGAGQATPPGGQQAPTPTNPGGGNTSPATPGNTPAGDGGAAGPSSGGGGNPGTPANNSPTEPPSQPSQPTPPQQPSPASPTPQIPSQPPDGGAASPVSSPAQGPASLPAEPPASPPQQTPTAQAPSAPTAGNDTPAASPNSPATSGGQQPSALIPSPPPASGSGVPPQASSAAAAAAATATAAGGVGAGSTECTTSTGLKGKLGPGGCFANARQDCTVSDGIPGATTDTGICAPVVTVGSPCSLSDGTKGTAQLQGLGTTLSCIGNSFTAGAPCSLPFNVAGTIANDGKTCKPPVVAPPAGAACPVPGITTLGLMQPDGKTCLPPTQSGGPDTSGGSGGPSLSDGGQCAVGGLAGQIERGSCRALEPKSGDPCFRGGQFAYFSNAIPDGILASDLKTCMIVNDTCNANGVQGRWSPSYLCVVPPPAFGNPTQDGGACQRGQIWGGRWDAASSTCILPGDPCPTGIYGPNARDCIAKPTVGTVCATAQGFNGTFNDAGLCVATIPPGARTPCLSVRTEAGTVSLTPNGTLCQIAPTPDTPMGVLQNIAPGSFCSNGKDSGAFTDAISCEVVQRPGGISAIPEGTAGNPNNDIASLQSVSRATKSKTWIPGVAAGVGVAGGLLLLALLAWKCGWFKSLARKHRRRHQTAAFGPGDGILEEAPYAPPQTFATVGNSRNQPYRDDNFSATTSPPTSPPATSRFSIISDQHPADPFADTSYNNHRRSQQLSDYSYAPEALSPRHPGSPSMMPSSPPMMAGSPPGSPGMQHVVQEPLLAGYPANPPAYPATEEYGHNRR
ncbi:unnamed protein product [Cutaneotrichosporon oleaginosum]